MKYLLLFSRFGQRKTTSGWKPTIANWPHAIADAALVVLRTEMQRSDEECRAAAGSSLQ